MLFRLTVRPCYNGQQIFGSDMPNSFVFHFRLQGTRFLSKLGSMAFYVGLKNHVNSHGPLIFFAELLLNIRLHER